MTSAETAAVKAPYPSLTTVHNFLDRLGGGPIPPRIDKDLLESYSGGTQALLMATLRAMGLVTESGATLPALEKVATDPEARKRHFRDFYDSFYKEQARLAEQNATNQQLVESFSSAFGFKGSTLQKAVVFYLALADYVGAPKSPFFKAPRVASASSRKTGTAKRTPMTPKTPEVHGTEGSPGDARLPSPERTTISLGELGEVSVEVRVRWLELPSDLFTGLRDAIDKLRSLAVASDEVDEVYDEDEEVSAS